MLFLELLLGGVEVVLELVEDLLDLRVVDRPDLLVSFDELNDLMGMKRLDELEKKFVGG